MFGFACVFVSFIRFGFGYCLCLLAEYSCKRVTLIVCEIEVEAKCEEQCVALIETGLYLITCNPVSTVSVGMQLAGKSWRCCFEGGSS